MGDETPRNAKPRSNQLQGKTPAGERRIIDAAPASLGGQNPKENKNLGATSSNEKHPLASAASSTPPQVPLGYKTMRNTRTSGQPAPRTNTPGERGIINAVPDSFGGQNPEEQRQQQRRRPTSKGEANEPGF